MLIRRLNDDSIEFADIEPVEAELLRQVSVIGEAHGDAGAEARLFSAPADPSETQFLKDWEEYVRPELRHLFLAARKVVEEDVSTLSAKAGRFSRMVFPLSHGEAWLSALNQARLILAAKFDFADAELALHEVPKTLTKRGLVLLQINFYAAIQERVIEALQGEDDGYDAVDVG